MNALDYRIDAIGRLRRVNAQGKVISFDTTQETEYIRNWLVGRKKFIVISLVEKELEVGEGTLRDIANGERKSMSPMLLEKLTEFLSVKFGMPPPSTLRVSLLDFIVCSFFKLKIGTLQQKTNKREVVKARQIAMFFSKEYTKLTLDAIGREFNRDHATVLYSCKTVANLMETDKKYKFDIGEIKKTLPWVKIKK